MRDPFEPTWRRGLLAFAVAAAAFLLPQEAPLVFYPLNHPSDVTYLEITCQASAAGETRISWDTGRGFNDLQMIRIPIAPSSQPYTYTFPLWDAPLQGMMLEPLNRPGSLIVTNLRIHTRRGREIKRFTADDFDATHEIARIAPIANGWEFVSTPDAHRPYSLCGFFPPIIPDGMNARNFLRCLLSWGYLSLMLWILLLAVLFIVRRPEAGDRRPEIGDGRPQSEGEDAEQTSAAEGRPSRLPPLASGPRPDAFGWKGFARDAAFLAFIALLFAAVGNRGLIKDSVRYSRFPVQPVKPGLRLEFDLAVDPARGARLFWDTGHGFNPAESLQRNYDRHPLYQTLRFDLPDFGQRKQHLQALRFAPLEAAGTVRIFGLRVVDQGRRTRLRLPPDCLRAGRDIASIEVQDSQALIRTAPAAREPTLAFTPEAVKAVDRAIAEAGSDLPAR